MKYFIAILGFFLFCSSAYSQEKCHIVYGLFDNYRPYEWFDENGKAVGMNIDLLKALAREADCGFEIRGGTWNDMLGKLKKGEISMMSVSPTEETQEFSIPITQSTVLYRYILCRTDSPNIQDISGMKGKTVLVINGSFSDKQLTAMSAEYKITVLHYPSHKEALFDLSRGVGDAFVSTLVAATNILKDNEITNIKSTGYPLLPSTYGFVVSKSEPRLYEHLNNAMERLKNSGEYFEIVKKWSVAEDNSKVWIKYGVIILGLGGVIFVLAMLWNKSLYMQVQRKTITLKDEISVRQMAEQALSLSNRRFQYLSELFQKVLDALPEQIYLLNKTGSITWANTKKLDNQELFKLSGIRTEIDEALNSMTSFTINRISDDAKSWYINGIILDKSEDPLLIVVSNITENVKLRDEALMSARLAALGEMAASVAHEINNPTGLIFHNAGFLNRMRQEFFEKMDEAEQLCGMDKMTAGEEASAAEKIIDDSLMRIKKCVAELKEFSKPKSNVTEEISLSDCLDSAVRFTSFFVGKYTAEFICEVDKKAGPILGNATHIEQAIINLVQNACNALTAQSQKIVCKIEPAGGGKYTLLSVTDEGMGMDEDTRKKSTGAFFTTRKSSGGTGLGLSVVSRIVKEHKGFMVIESEQGKGTCVSMYFPALSTESAE